MAQDATPGNSRPRKVGLVVIHGVGEAAPGGCLDTLIEALQSVDPGYRAESYNFVAQLPERADATKGESKTDAKPLTWPVHQKRLTYAAAGMAGQPEIDIRAAELYWADTTAIDPGRLSTIVGLFRVIIESHHLVHAMLDRTGRATAWLAHRILAIASYLLRGPIAALTVAASVYCSVVLFQPDAVGAFVRDNGLGPVHFIVVQAALVGFSIYLFRLIRRSGDLSWYDFVVWLALVSVILMLLAAFANLADLLGAVPSLKAKLYELLAGEAKPGCVEARGYDYRCICGLYSLIIWFWRLQGLLLVICLVLLGIEMIGAAKRDDRLVYDRFKVAISILILQFMLWTTIVVTLIYPVLNRAEGNAAISELVRLPAVAQFKDRFDEEETHKGVRDLFTLPNIQQEWIPRFKFVYVATTFALVCLMLAGMYLQSQRRARGKAGIDGLEGDALRRRLDENRAAIPRLLFNSNLVTTLIILFVVLIILVMYGSDFDAHPTFIAVRAAFLPLAALFAIAISWTFGPVVTNTVHIARDLIDHQFQAERENGRIFLPRAFRDSAKLPRRDRISSRLIALLDAFVKPEKFDDVIFVAHSQGSIVAFDYLVKSEAQYEGLGAAAPSILTFGSPLGTLYQKYFPTEYKQKFPAPADLCARLKRWVNIYRVDDYIGGPIQPPDGLDVENRVMKPDEKLMHTGYWREVDVARALDELIRGAPASFATSAAAVPRRMPELWIRPKA